MVGKARSLYEELRRAVVAEYDDCGPDRPPLPPPGRDRHAVRVHRSTSRRSRTTRSRSATATRSRRSASRSRAHEHSCSTSCAADWSYAEDAALEATRRSSSALVRLDEAELAVEIVRVARVQEPLRVGERAFVDREPDELDAEAPTAMLVEDVHVGEIRLRCIRPRASARTRPARRRGTGRRPARRRRSARPERLARASARPVRLVVR